MAEAVRGYKPKEFIIQSLDGEKSIDITNSILSIDYFEDILKPDISMVVQVTNTYSIVSGLPVRGGERVYVDLETASGDFTINTQQDVLYVYKVSGIDGARMAENFTLHLTTREYLSNETSRCSRRYSGKISESVKDILTNVLGTSKYIDTNIEETSNAYSFIGSMKKPFNVLTWLGPKALSSSAGSSDSNPNGSKTEQATGTAGFFFFENKEGYNFKSIDGMVSQLKQSEGSADNKKIFRYSYGGKVTKANDVRNNYEIINFSFERNIDLRKSLRVGMYSNVTYFYDQESHEVTVYKYVLKDQIKDKKLSKDPLAVSDEIGESISRILVRTSDNGIMETNGGTSTSGRTPADQAKSLARYNLLFTQALNILIPCNINLKVGDIIYCEFPEMNAGNSKEIDSQTSGYYLIRELRHHFSANQNTTSLRLMRDSYGVN